jgi:signal transduction histidine kinase
MLKRAPFEVSEIDLKETVGEVIGFVSALEGRGVILKYAPASTTLRVKGDPIQLQQVVLNLIMNAIDAVPNRKARSGK